MRIIKLILRLYRQHDLDLIALHRNDDFCFSAAVRKALDAYVNKKTLSICAPGPNKDYEGRISKQIQLIIKLDDIKDVKSIEYIKSIKEGYRNSCVKNLLRGYLTYPVVYPYMESDSSFQDIKENNDIFKKNNVSCETIDKKRHYIQKKHVKKDPFDEKLDTIYIENVEKKVDAKKLADEILKEPVPEEPVEKENQKEISDSENDEMLDTFEALLNGF